MVASLISIKNRAKQAFTPVILSNQIIYKFKKKHT
jgi:hypothetical protein